MVVRHNEKLLTIINRTLNQLDRRLIDHGIRVMMVLGDMLQAEETVDEAAKQNLYFLALLHDVGMFHTNEIDALMRLDSGSGWAHSVYGYLFFREFTPLREWAKVILYHHTRYDELPEDEPAKLLHYAQLLSIADRAVIWHDSISRSAQELRLSFAQASGHICDPEGVRLFWEADERFHTLSKLDEPIRLYTIMDYGALDAHSVLSFLGMVMHIIDFRSPATVTHTMSVMEIGLWLARKMGLPEPVQQQIYFGGLLHDLGKIGIPPHILEKPDKLTGEEMQVMRSHVELSGSIIDGCVEETVKRIAMRHHEKLDGSGYPMGLRAEELTLPERIIAVADITSALRMSRSYKEAYPKEHCLRILRAMADAGKLDRSVVETLETNYDEILEETDRACEPAWKSYERIRADYAELVGLFSHS